ncbi:MAG: radical SAM protein [Verrucomicrobiota bacterium]
MNAVLPNETPFPYLVAINVTRRCNLNCAHCYLDATQRWMAQSDELRQRDLAPVFAELGQHAPGTIVVLTGGEPLLHSEIEPMVEAGVAAGLRMVIGTNGVLLSEARLKRFKALGLAGVGISLDSVYADEHDGFRGVPGAFEKSCQAIRLCAAQQLHVQVHFTVTSRNYRQLEPAVNLSKNLGASIINFFFLVCVGRGRPVLDLPAALYEQVLREIADLQTRCNGIMIQCRCAPHFKRVLYQRNPQSPYTRATGYDGGGCLAGTHYCRIDPAGEVTPCPYIELSVGNIRRRSFWELWQAAPLFQSLRQSAVGGRCGECEYRLLCGGCRARSLVEHGTLFSDDPSCDYTPQGNNLIVVPQCAAPAPTPVTWTPEALARLNRVPIFLRKTVQRKLEERAAAEGTPVTVELMQRYRQEREKELGIKFADFTDQTRKEPTP